MNKIALLITILTFFIIFSSCSSEDRQTNKQAETNLYIDPEGSTRSSVKNQILSVPVEDHNLWVKLMMPGGSDKKPTVIFLHGNPGNEKNEDIAQALRRGGFNTVLFSYSGTWGNQGDFTFKNAINDTKAVLNFLIQHGEDYNIDENNIILVGHSMGADIAVLVSALKDTRIRGVALIDIWNGHYALNNMSDSMIEQYVENLSQRLCVSISSPRYYVSEIINSPELDIINQVRKLDMDKIFIFSSSGEKRKWEELCDNTKKEEYLILDASDHSFSNKRIELGSCLYSWLQECIRNKEK